MKVLFWGTTEFALPGFHALVEEGHEVAAVITQPDRPAGRGRKLRATPIRAAAEEEGIPVLTPERPRGAEFFDTLREFDATLSIVAAYGHILLPECLAIPALGSINIHGSLLPELRGAAPVNWAIARGHGRTGITIIRMTAGMDEGPILLQRETPIGEEETATELYLRLAELGAEALLETLVHLEVGELAAVEQDHARATYAPKITREIARIDWTLSPHEVANHLRAMDEIPGAWTTIGGAPIKLFSPSLLPVDSPTASGASTVPGQILGEDPSAGLLVETGGGRLGIREVQSPGGKRMSSAEWMRGRRGGEGAVFE